MRIVSLLTVVVIITSPVRSAPADGTWSSFLQGANYGLLLESGAAGNWIWFISDYGVGKMHRTGAQPSFSYFTDLGLKIPLYDYRLAIGDSVTIAFYGGGYDRRDINIMKNSIVRTVHCPEIPRTLICEPAGSLWVGADNALYRFDDSAWTRHAYNPSDSVSATAAMIIHGDSILFTSGNGYIGHLSGAVITSRNLNAPLNGQEVFAGLFTGPNGNPMALTTNALYDISKNKLVAEVHLSANNQKAFTLDSLGNLWFFGRGSYADTLIRFSIASGTSENMRNGIFTSTIFSTTDGVCYLNWFNGLNPHLRFVCLSNNSRDSVIIRYSQLPHNEETDLHSMDPIYSNSGSNMYWIKLVLESEDDPIDSAYIIRYGTSREKLPPLTTFVWIIFEHPDGHLFAGTVEGLFYLNGSSWEKVGGLSGIPIVNMTVDNKGKIWGTSLDALFHQTDRGWDIIDHTNSNLPEFKNCGTNIVTHQENGVILVDSANTLWTILDSSIARTTDGHHWDIYTFNDLGIGQKMGFNGPYLYKNPEGAISFIGRNDTHSMIRGTFFSTGIRRDTLSPPDSLECNPAFIDRSGGIWAYRGPVWWPIGSRGLYRYYSNQWFTYDSSNAPITWAMPYNELPTGSIHMISPSGDIVFNYSQPNDVKRSQTHFKQTPSVILSLSSLRKSIAVDYYLSSDGEVSFSLFDVRGRLVKILDERKGMRGAFSRTFSVDCSPGLYFVRLSAPEGSQTAKVILK